MAELRVLGGGATTTYPVEDSETIGRGDSCSICIDDTMMSRVHAEIRRVGTGYVLVDLGSTHGTFVGGKKVLEHPLEDGDEIVIGATHLRFERMITAHNLERPINLDSAAVNAGTHTEKPLDGQGAFLPADAIPDQTTLKLNYEKLRAIYEITWAAGAQSDLDTVLGRILDATIKIMGAGRGVVLLMDPKTATPSPRVARWKPGEPTLTELSRTLINDVLRTRTGVLSVDTSVDERYRDAVSIQRGQIRSVMCVPLLFQNELVGMLQVDSQSDKGLYDEKHLAMLTAIGNHAALLTKSALLSETLRSEAGTRAQLERFLPPNLAARIVSGDLNFSDAGELREVTVFFADMRGFTSLSESLHPGELVALLNDYFDLMVEVLFKHGGILDKYVGDELIGIFGVPLPSSMAPLAAVACAVEMQERLTTFNAEREENGLRTLAVGIGINTGSALCGAIGSHKSKQFTAIGDAMNTGARLCSLAGPGETILGQDTFNAVVHSVSAEELPPVQVKGKQKPLVTYRVESIRLSFDETIG